MSFSGTEKPTAEEMLGSHSIQKLVRHVILVIDKPNQKRWLNQGPKRELKLRGKNTILSPSPRKFTNETTQAEEKKKKDEAERKTEIKDRMDRDPGWFNSNPNESDLVKHIEVLQRFIDRYNTVSCPASPEKTKPKMTEDGRETLLKVLDKQPSKKFSTFVRTQKKKSKEIHQKPEERNFKLDLSVPPKPYITLANEPMVPLAVSSKFKPIVTVGKNLINPDSVTFDRTVRQQLRPRLYKLVNTKSKSKELEAYVKRTIHSKANNENVKEKKIPEVTVGDFFTDRYLRKPESEKGDVISGSNVSSKLQDSLLEGRRSSSTETNRSMTTPEIHLQTSPLVQKTHLPLTVCKKTKPTNAGQTEAEVPTTEPHKLKTEEDKKRPKRNNTIFNKLMTYFKR